MQFIYTFLYSSIFCTLSALCCVYKFKLLARNCQSYWGSWRQYFKIFLLHISQTLQKYFLKPSNIRSKNVNKFRKDCNQFESVRIFICIKNMISVYLDICLYLMQSYIQKPISNQFLIQIYSDICLINISYSSQHALCSTDFCWLF